MVNPKSTCAREGGIKAGYRSIHAWNLGRPTRGALRAVGFQEPGPGVYALCWGQDPETLDYWNMTEPDVWFPWCV